MWHELSVGWVWKRPQDNGIGDGISLLLDARHEPALEVGRTYLLFLQPAGWKILCANRTLAQVSHLGMDADLSWMGTGGEKPLWAGATVGEVEAQVEALLKQARPGD